MKNNIIKLTALLATLSITACGGSVSSISQSNSESSSIENPSVPVTSVKTGLLALNKTKSYTADVTYNGTKYFSIYVNEKYVGFDSATNDEVLDFFIKGEEGIFPLNKSNGKFLPGEYQAKNKEENYTDLFDNTTAKTVYGVASDYVTSVADDANDLVISNKTYKLALLDYVGIERSFYVDLNTVTASYKEAFSLKLEFGSNVYNLTFKDFGTAKDENVENFLAKGGTAYTPDENMKAMKRLLKSNNFVSAVYDFDSGTDGDYNGLSQVFNPHYFYTTAAALGDKNANKSGYISFNRSTPVTDESSPYYIPGFDTQPKGIYMFMADGMRHSIAPQVVYENPDMEYFMHYPSLLKLINKTQYFSEGIISEFSSKYTYKKDCYILKDISLIKDFATNFSLNNSYDFKTCIPYALGVEFSLNKEDKNTVIIFHYCFTYGAQKYDYLVPLYSFGQTNDSILDGFYDLYND